MKNKAILFVFFLELGAGFANNYHDLAGDNPLLIGRAGYETQDRKWRFEYEHQSSILTGPPVDKRLDQREQERIGIIYRMEF